MAVKDKIKEVYPRAYAEKYTKNSVFKEHYYLIWTSRLQEERKRIGEGATEAKAWKDALPWIEDSAEKELKQKINENRI